MLSAEIFTQHAKFHRSQKASKYSFYWNMDKQAWANSANPEQMLQNASDLGLYCVPLSQQVVKLTSANFRTSIVRRLGVWKPRVNYGKHFLYFLM